MVFFLCSVCGESVKKAKVSSHRCNCQDWSCMDCGKIFPGMSYNQHTSCMSEAQKYEGHLYRGGSKSGKETVAQIWLRSCAEAAEKAGTDSTLSSDLQRAIPSICSLENIPRKKKKFDNFMKNQADRLAPTACQAAWDYISGIFSANKTAADAKQAAAQVVSKQKSNAKAKANGKKAEGNGNGNDSDSSGWSSSDEEGTTGGSKKAKAKPVKRKAAAVATTTAAAAVSTKKLKKDKKDKKKKKEKEASKAASTEVDGGAKKDKKKKKKKEKKEKKKKDKKKKKKKEQEAS